MKPVWCIVIAVFGILTAQVAIKELESGRGMCLLTSGRNAYLKSCKKP